MRLQFRDGTDRLTRAYPTSPLASRSDDLLLIPIHSPSFFQSYVGAAALVEVLAGMLVARGGQSVVDNIDNLERCRREMGEYWQE